MVDYVGMGNLLTRCRMHNGYTQYDVAEFVNVCEKTIQNIEGGKRSPEFETVLKLFDIYGIDFAEFARFFTRDEETTYAIMLYEHSDKGRKKKMQPI